MAEPEVQAEEKLPQENTQPTMRDVSPAETEEVKNSAENGIKEILDKMPVKDKRELQSDYGTIQYYNITYQGNYVDNSGTVYGGIAQQQQQGQGIPASNSKETIQDFFRPGTQPAALAALLTLASFESVQESLFHEIISLLSERFIWGKESDANEHSGTLAYLQTADELLAPFSIRREMLPFKYGNSELKLRCLVFEDGRLPDQVRRWAWEMYPQLRPVLTDWLLYFQTKTDSAAERTLAYAATRGLAVYASLDAEYACHNIIPLLERSCTAQADVKYLVTFFRQFMQAEDCQMVGDELLRRWCGRHDRFLWQIPYQLYSGKDERQFCKDVPGALRERLLQDSNGLGNLDPKWYGQSRGYFLYPAHRNRASAALLAMELGRCFSDCKTPDDRYWMAVYFLVLFRWDYLTDFSSEPELSFLRSLRNKEARYALLPIFQFIFRKIELRHTMCQVLECHFAEINTNSGDISHLEKQFEFLAFTKNRADFQYTIKLLDDCARQKNARPAAVHLKNHLNGILQQRQAIQSAGKV